MCHQITMLLTFEIFGLARNHGKKFPKLSQISFSGIVNYGLNELEKCSKEKFAGKYSNQNVNDLHFKQ